MAVTSKISDPGQVDRLVGMAIARAELATEEIARRDHILADRAERVNQFIVRLHSELSSLRYSVDEHVCNAQWPVLLVKTAWLDAGVPRPGQFGSYDHKAERWMHHRALYLDSPEAKFASVEHSLAELSRLTTGMNHLAGMLSSITMEARAVLAST